jgi:hypothetical protein
MDRTSPGSPATGSVVSKITVIPYSFKHFVEKRFTCFYSSHQFVSPSSKEGCGSLDQRSTSGSLPSPNQRSARGCGSLGHEQPRHERGFYCSGECFNHLPPTNDRRHSDDACSAAGATNRA